MEGGRYRRRLHHGQFSEALHELVGIWLSHSGYERVGAPVELYHDTPANAGDIPRRVRLTDPAGPAYGEQLKLYP